MIYLDNSATTKPYPEVLDTFRKVAESHFANPSSIHGKGSEAERLLLQARSIVADLLHVHSKEIVFTSGGTEGNNLAIKGTAFQHQSRGKHLITTAVEHASTLESFKQLEDIGFEVTYLPVDAAGRISMEDLRKEVRKDTILVSMIHVNNEIGTIQPIEEAGEYLRNFPKAVFHVDHVQGLSKVPLNFKKAKVDLCTMSAHKVHGLKGSGILYVRSGVKLFPLFTGGEQEGTVRAGTENVPGVVAMAKALRVVLEKSKSGIKQLRHLQETARKELCEIDGILINTPEQNSAPHILNFSVPRIKPEVLIHTLEEEGIYISTKSACSSKAQGGSRILEAAGYGPERSEHALRVSFSFENRQDDIERLVEALEEVLPKLKSVMG
ncbi:cysteine desulfurase family protein [Pseudalkalibacillus caeni]|uniref:Cysteine desulfurase n=1 Tax=Exobacillus caeni TaxID=2574798 RepID=A0A5R9FBQ6_9BACL|nr:cysteine desulfurase family protein [Pseudalkalibacillus caeni]TLS39098.1 cysteine desulfurase [Pseudalkalibacillus caeni]